MRSLRYGLVLEVREDAIREENGDAVRSGIASDGNRSESILRRGTTRPLFSSSAGGLFRGRMMN